MGEYPRTLAALRRAQLEHDAESLAIHINRRLYRDGVRPGDMGAIGAVVAEIAPGWDFIDATAVGDGWPRVALSTYSPESPL